jgi:hypothetical protein
MAWPHGSGLETAAKRWGPKAFLGGELSGFALPSRLLAGCATCGAARCSYAAEACPLPAIVLPAACPAVGRLPRVVGLASLARSRRLEGSEAGACFARCDPAGRSSERHEGTLLMEPPMFGWPLEARSRRCREPFLAPFLARFAHSYQWRQLVRLLCRRAQALASATSTPWAKNRRADSELALSCSGPS